MSSTLRCSPVVILKSEGTIDEQNLRFQPVDTVDGRNLPFDMVNIPLFAGFYISDISTA